LESAVVPIWKIKREVSKAIEHISSVPQLIYEPVIQKMYDKDFYKKLRTYQGSQAPSKKIAVFLIYQPDGLSESVFLSITHLSKSGFSPVIISNCALLSSDKERLCSSSFLVVERKNFGYDFGGYRDAVWLLRRLQVQCDEVLFLNDSVWFPIFDDSNILEEMAAENSDYIGTQVFGDRSLDGSFNGFFGSYCFFIKKPLLDSHAFNSFWDKYQLSSVKEVVLRRGERAFSKAMLKASANPLSFYTNERFDQVINSLDFPDTLQALGDLIAMDPQVISKRLSLMNSKNNNDSWMADAKKLIIYQSKSKSFIGSSPVVSLNKLKFPMIKKNKEQLYMLAKQSIVRAIDEGRIQGLNKIVEIELRLKAFGG
jgi:hypothetical protein